MPKAMNRSRDGSGVWRRALLMRDVYKRQSIWSAVPRRGNKIAARTLKKKIVEMAWATSSSLSLIHI